MFGMIIIHIEYISDVSLILSLLLDYNSRFNFLFM